MSDEAKRDEDGKFLPGRSGNPKGRPKAQVNRIETLRAYISTHAQQLIDVLIKKALVEGDDVSARTLLDKILPTMTDTAYTEERVRELEARCKELLERLQRASKPQAA